MILEVPVYKFAPEVSREDAQSAVESLDGLLATAPGFLGRRVYHDAGAALWVETVAWRSIEDARAAQTSLESSPLFAPFAARLAPDFAPIMLHATLVHELSPSP
jgi:heme-degrading monooxygenase HmoA